MGGKQSTISTRKHIEDRKAVSATRAPAARAVVSTAAIISAPASIAADLLPICILPELRGIILEYYCFSATILTTDTQENPIQAAVPDQKSINRFNLFGIPYPIVKDLVEAANYLAWGKCDKLKKILERNQDPLLLTTPILVEDHRGPGITPAGTLFQISLYVKDVEIKDKKDETMAKMLQRYTKERCCKEDEVTKRQVQAHQVMQKEKAKQAAQQPDDTKLLTTAWEAITQADEKTLETNSTVTETINALDMQLKKPGNEKVFIKAWEFSERDFNLFGGLRSTKNNFAVNRVIGLIAKRRFTASQLQLFFHGVENFRDSEYTVERIDICLRLGISSDAVDKRKSDSNSATRSHSILGLNSHMDISGFRLFAGRVLSPRCDMLEDFFQTQHSILERLTLLPTKTEFTFGIS